MKRYFKKFSSAIITYSFAIFTLLFFSPLEIILGNISNFQIFADSAVLILLAVCALSALVLSAILSFLPIKPLKILNITVFAISIGFYIQSLFLNNKLISLTGEEQVFSKSSVIINAVVWVAIIAVVILCWLGSKKIKKEKMFLTTVKFISLALIVMQTVGLGSIYFSCEKDSASKNCYFSTTGKLEVSDKNNVLYFIIDTCAGDIVDEALNDSPDIFSEFDGFTYYPNNTTTYSRTFPSITYMLSNERCYFDIPSTEYINNAFEKSTFLPTIDSLGTDIRLYTEVSYIGESVKGKIDNLNYLAADANNINLGGFIKQAAKISLFRGAPYAAKKKFEYTAEDVNAAITKPIVDRSAIFDDYGFYQEIKNQKVSVNSDYDSAFRFYHMFGTHPGASINENGELEGGVSLSTAFKGDIKILNEYFAQLKALGVYDSSTIIVTADHGWSGGGDSLDLPKNASCLMLVKPADADSSKEIKVSQAPVCHEDLFATVISALGGNSSEFGRTIYEIGENEDRERFYYYSSLYSDIDGEIALREYSLKGDAKKLENYVLTGEKWDINYSMNTVSKTRLE